MMGLGLLATATVSSLLQQWAIKSYASKTVDDAGPPEAEIKPLPPTSGPMPAAKPGRRALPAESNTAPAARPPPLVNQADEPAFRLGSPYKVGKQGPVAKPPARPTPTVMPGSPASAPPAAAPPSIAPPSLAPGPPPGFNPTLRPASGTESRV